METLALTGSYLTPSFEHAAATLARVSCECDVMAPDRDGERARHRRAARDRRLRGSSSGAGRWGVITDRDVCARGCRGAHADDVATGGVLLVHPDDRLTTSPSACSTSTRATRSSWSRARPPDVVVCALDIAHPGEPG